jgi:PAS domain S-box-containing protein
MGEDNISKIKYLVGKLNVRDQELRDKVKRISILETAFHRTGQPIAVLTLDNKYIFVNKSYAVNHGYKCPDELIGKDVNDLFDINTEDNPMDVINESLQNTGSWFGKYICPHKSGKNFLAEVYLDIIEDESIIICTCNKVDCTIKNDKVEILKS